MNVRIVYVRLGPIIWQNNENTIWQNFCKKFRSSGWHVNFIFYRSHFLVLLVVFVFSLIYLLSSLKLLVYGGLADNLWQNYEFSVVQCIYRGYAMFGLTCHFNILSNKNFKYPICVEGANEGVAEGLQLKKLLEWFLFLNELLNWLCIASF